MQAMTMPFTVKDSWVFQAVGPGDELQATLVVTDESSWLEELVINKKGAAGDAAEPLPPIPGEPNPGDLVPEFTLVNQDGRPIQLGQYRGKAVVVTFIYTRCPLPEYCPRMTGHFAQLEQALQKEPELYEKTHLLTVSFDYEHDSPDIIREYARTQVPEHSGRFDHWELATGSAEEVQAITTFFGLTYLPEQDQYVHSLRTGVIGPDGKLFEIYRGNEWEPMDILNDLRSMDFD